MSRLLAESFLQIDEADLSNYVDARAAELDLLIAPPFRSSVLENLAALRTHARRVTTALNDLNAPAVEARPI